MIGWLVILGAGAAIYWFVLVIGTAWMLSHPPRRTYASALARGVPGSPAELPVPRAFEEWRFECPVGRVSAWDIAGDDPRGPVVVLCHGWADSRIGGLFRVAAHAPVASRIILWDMRGHGETPGVCRLGTAEPADLHALLERLGIAREIVLHGWSLGAGVALVEASRNPAVAAVIAESPYRLPQTPARRVLTLRRMPCSLNLRPALWLLRSLGARGLTLRAGGAFDRAEYARRVSVPILVLHGEQDEVCPVEDGREIAASAPNATLHVVPGAKHNNLWTEATFAADCTSSVRGFVTGLAPRIGP